MEWALGRDAKHSLMSFIWHTFKLDFCTLCGFVLNWVAQFFHVLHVLQKEPHFLFSRFVFPGSISSLSRQKVRTSRIHLSIKKDQLNIYIRSELSNLMTKTKQLSTVDHFLCWIVVIKGCLASSGAWSMVADSSKLSHLSHTLRLAYWLTTLPCRLSHQGPVL